MENASKALMMAGGVLIGVLIISLAVYLFADFGAKSASINAQNAEKQLASFNSKFTSYESLKDKEGKWQITIYNIITVKGYAIENNNSYDKDNDEERINVMIENVSILDKNDTELIQEYGYDTSNGAIKKFKCQGIQYNNRGKIKSINFNVFNDN